MYKGYEADVLPINDDWITAQRQGSLVESITAGALDVYGVAGSKLRYSKNVYLSSMIHDGISVYLRGKKVNTASLHESPAIEYIAYGLTNNIYQDYISRISLTTNASTPFTNTWNTQANWNTGARVDVDTATVPDSVVLTYGNTWGLVSFPILQMVVKLKDLGSGIVLAGTGPGASLPSEIYRSTDSGLHWTSVKNYAEGYYFTDISYDPSLDPNIYAVHFNPSPMQTHHIVKSIDNGATWTAVLTELTQHPTETTFASCIVGADTVIASRMPASGVPAKIIGTSNGGTSWTDVGDTGINDTYIYKFLRLASGDILGFTQIPFGPPVAHVLTSSDNGATWVDLGNPDSAKTIYDAVQLPSGDIVACFDTPAAGKIEISSDFGATWTQVLAVGSDPVTSIVYTNSGHLVACTLGGTTVRSTNDGATWAFVGSTGVAAWSLSNPSADIVLAGGVSSPNLLARSTQEGQYAYPASGTDTLDFDSGTVGAAWTSFDFVGTVLPNTDLEFRFRTADTQANLAAATWSSYFAAGGSLSSLTLNRWIEVEANLSTTDIAATPILTSLTINGGSPSGNAVFSFGPKDAVSVVYQQAADLTQYHEFSFTIQNVGSNTVYTLYMDGTSIATNNLAYVFPTNIQNEYAQFYMDPISNSVSDAIDLDYFRWLVFGIPASSVPGMSLGDSFLNANVDSVVLAWELPDPPLIVTEDVRFEAQVDSVATFNSTNLRTYYWNSDTDNNIIEFQNGKVMKGFVVPTPYRQDSAALTYYYRVRPTGSYATLGWSPTQTFTIPQRKLDYYANNLFNIDLADKYAYGKEGDNSNIYQIMQMYADQLDSLDLETWQTGTDNFIAQCRDANFTAIWGDLVDLVKGGDLKWVEYRELVKVLLDAFLHGGTNAAIKRFVKILSGQEPQITEYSYGFTGWRLGRNYINYPLSYVVLPNYPNITASGFYATVNSTFDTVTVQGLSFSSYGEYVVFNTLQSNADIAGASLPMAGQPVGEYYVTIRYNVGTYSINWLTGNNPEQEDPANNFVIWSYNWDGTKVSNLVDRRRVARNGAPSWRNNPVISPIARIFSGYEIDHGCEIHISDPFEFFTTILSAYMTSVIMNPITVASAAEFPDSGLIKIKGEKISYPDKTATTFATPSSSVVTRAMEGTEAQAHWVGEVVANAFYTDMFEKYIDLIKPANVRTHIIYHHGGF